MVLLYYSHDNDNTCSLRPKALSNTWFKHLAMFGHWKLVKPWGVEKIKKMRTIICNVYFEQFFGLLAYVSDRKLRAFASNLVLYDK